MTLRARLELALGLALAIAVVLAVAGWSQRNAALTAARAIADRARLSAADSVVAKDVPKPPIPPAVADQVKHVQAAVPDARPSRSEDLGTDWLTPQGVGIPCISQTVIPPRNQSDSNPEPTEHPDDVILRRDTPARIRLVSVDLTTKAGATGTVGRATVERQLDGATILDGPLIADTSTVWRVPTSAERPAWWAVASAGATTDARLWAGLVAGRRHWGAHLIGLWGQHDRAAAVGAAWRF